MAINHGLTRLVGNSGAIPADSIISNFNFILERLKRYVLGVFVLLDTELFFSKIGTHLTHKKSPITNEPGVVTESFFNYFKTLIATSTRPVPCPRSSGFCSVRTTPETALPFLIRFWINRLPKSLLTPLISHVRFILHHSFSEFYAFNESILSTNSHKISTENRIFFSSY